MIQKSRLTYLRKDGSSPILPCSEQQQPHPSPFLDKYRASMRFPVPEIGTYSKIFSANMIRYHPSNFYPILQIKAQFARQEVNCFFIQAKISYFTLEISLGHQEFFTKLKVLKIIGKGSFGTVYKIDEKYVMKCIPFISQGTENFSIEINKAIEEFCYNKILGALGIAPKTQNPFGFDLLISKKGIAFALQLCSHSQKITKDQTLSLLQVMHSLRIVHGDVKSQNVVWSDFHQKNVFIDFNCSQSLKEKVGFKTLTKFRGTISHASEEMKNLWSNAQRGWVDLYYNDVFGAHKIEQLFHSSRAKLSKPTHYKLAEKQFIKCWCSHVGLRFHLFCFPTPQLLEKIKMNLEPSLNMISILQTESYDGHQRDFHNFFSNIIELINESFNFITKIAKINSEYVIVKKVYQETFLKYLRKDQQSPPQEKLISFKTSTKIRTNKIADILFFPMTYREFQKNNIIHTKKKNNKDISQQIAEEIEISQNYFNTILSVSKIDDSMIITEICKKFHLPHSTEMNNQHRIEKVCQKLNQSKFERKSMKKISIFFQRQNHSFLTLIMAYILVFQESFYYPIHKFMSVPFSLLSIIQAIFLNKCKNNKIIGLEKVLYGIVREVYMKRSSSSQINKLQFSIKRLCKKSLIDDSASLIINFLSMFKCEPNYLPSTPQIKRFQRNKKWNIEQRNKNYLPAILKHIRVDSDLLALDAEMLRFLFQEEALYLGNMCQILILASELEKTEKRKKFFVKFMKETEKYFCSSDLNEYIHYWHHTVVYQFNSFYLEMLYKYMKAEQYEDLSRKFLIWITRQDARILFILAEQFPIFSFLEKVQKSTQISSEMSKKILNSCDLFLCLDCVQFPSYAAIFATEIQNKFNKLVKFQKNEEVDIIADRLVFLEIQSFYPIFVSYFLYHRQTKTAFEFLKATCGQNSSQKSFQMRKHSLFLKELHEMVFNFVYAYGLLTQPFLDQMLDNLNNLKSSKNQELRCMTFFYLNFSRNLLNLDIRQASQHFQSLILKVTESALFAALLNLDSCMISIRIRIREMLPEYILKMLTKIKKHGKSQKANFWKKPNLIKIKIYGLRHSSLDINRLTKIVRKIGSSIHHKRIQVYVSRKINNILNNQVQKLEIPEDSMTNVGFMI